MAFRTTLAMAPLLLSALTGCGGGGGGSSPISANDAPSNQLPSPAVTATPVSGGAPLLVTFDASASTDADGQVIRYRWDFDDGSPTAAGAVVSHSFTAPGTYTVVLAIHDNDGASASRSVPIDVAPAGGGFTLSGRIRILTSSAVDSDTNDIGSVVASNDDFASAQPLPNPVSAGGYVNRPGTGPTGNLRVTGDPGDFFRVSLTGNETILLTVGDPDAGDLAMHLWRATPLQLIDSVVVTGNAGTLAAAAAGDYFIEIDAIDGFSTYILNLGQDAAITAQHAIRTTDDFVAGQVVAFREPGQELVLDPQEYRVREQSASTALLELGARARGPRNIRGAALGGHVSEVQFERWNTLLSIRALKQLPAVTRAEPNYIRRPHRIPNDPLFNYQWHFQDIGLPLAWDLPQGTADVIVAVIDTGVLTNHPDLANSTGPTQKLEPGYDFISDPVRANDGDGMDADPDDPGDLAFGGSSSFHGTHVAGTIGARADNGFGVAGVAWDSRIMPLRALGIDGGTSFDVTQAILYAAGLPNASGELPTETADIINLSLGSLFSSAAEQQAISDARAAGVIVIASAGNDASTTPSYPAGYDGVVAVSATTLSRSLAPYSNRGAWIDVAAPGGNNATDLNGDGLGDGVVSTLGDDFGPGPVTFGYAGLSGTSMAAPHVAGVAALMKAAYPGLTPEQFDTALIQGDLTDDLGPTGADTEFGHGLINAHKALVTAFDLANNSGNPIPAVLTGTPSSLNFGAFDTELEVVVGNAGEGVAAVTQVTSDAPWLTPMPDTVDADGLGTYRLSVDRTSVSDGTYLGMVRFSGASSTFSVTAIMQKTSLDIAANAGLHYIVLVNADTDQTVHTATASAMDGEYAFSFENVTAGPYQLFAGTDMDNDNFLCDGGEACGAFRTLDSPDVVLINGDRADLDFVSGYPIDLFSTSAAATVTQSFDPVPAASNNPRSRLARKRPPAGAVAP